MINRVLNKIDAMRDVMNIHSEYQAVFETPVGQKVLEHICKKAGVAKSIFVRGDPYKTAYNAGMRDLALAIIRFTKRDHKQMMLQIERMVENEDEQHTMGR